ncbi:MAG: hypothetical protein WCR54_07555 [Clostridia bacterium]
MKKLDFLIPIMKQYEIYLSKEKNEDYEINPEQFDKFRELFLQFEQITKNCDGIFKPIQMIPKELHGYLTATFIVFNIYGSDLLNFSKALSNASAISIDITGKKVEIDIVVPNIFRKKQN